MASNDERCKTWFVGHLAPSRARGQGCFPIHSIPGCQVIDIVFLDSCLVVGNLSIQLTIKAFRNASWIEATILHAQVNRLG
ncbi:MAG: hypothetical protein JW839_15825, partial [Candidatus Lokiarchaeota archaeon]|nr:hypothetical protein [Candidatus Lokiarchaeota archaeon]